MKRAVVFFVLTTALLTVALSSAASPGTVVLGSSVYAGPSGAGWGTSHPSEIFNGGDPSGLVTHIKWSNWGAAASRGQGLNAIGKPTGGYYGKLATIELRAYDKGQCSAGGEIAYERLSAREPSRPGGPLGPWRSWSGSKTLCQFGF